jgi:NitT/TauT family transport system permease protein
MDTPLVFAVLVTVSAIAMILFVLIEFIERLAIPWHASAREKGH